MANHLVIRNVDEEMMRALKLRAAGHGRSVEAEHLEILKSALLKPRRRSFAEVLESIPNIHLEDCYDARND